MTTLNPYSPPTSPIEAISPPPASESTWLRNLKAVVAVTITYSIISVLFGLTRSTMPEPFFLVMVVVASALASAWANIGLGTRIGWKSGGLPVVMLVFIAALVSYCLISFTVGNMLYRMINPIAIFSPYPSSFAY